MVTPKDPPAREGSRPKRILIVDDDELVASGLRAILELEGIVVEVVDRGRLVPAAVERFRPDAVVLDVGLPDVSGIEVYTEIASRWPDLNVIFSTGHADPLTVNQQTETPVPFLRKPYEVEDLLALLSSSRRA
ncbi:MAG TPA: response regulator [Thermoanaerobaculia bacterium]|nr:response regulator [Thermoanaerobaculia bacterium]